MEDDGGGSRRGSVTSMWPDGATLSSMDDVLEKLKLLDYETTFCVKKAFPPLDHGIFTVPGRVSPFPVFSALVSWALTTAKVDFLDWEFDDPSTASNNMLLEINKLGFTGDFPAAKLKTGYGMQVLNLLHFVVDRALRVKGVRLLRPVYDMTRDPVVSKVQDEHEIDDDVIADDDEDDNAHFDNDDNNGEDFDYNDMYGAAQETAASGPGANEFADVVAPSILESTVDPAEWKLEIERVAPLLKIKPTGGAREWRTHLDSMVKHEALLRETFPDVEIQLGKIGAQMGEIAARISAQERHIQGKFAHLGTEFKDKQAQVDSVTSEYTRLSSLVASLSENLATITEEVDGLKRQLDSRSDSMTDTSPLRRIRGALLELRAEIKRMDLHIGVLRHTLLNAKMHVSQKPWVQERRVNPIATL